MTKSLAKDLKKNTIKKEAKEVMSKKPIVKKSKAEIEDMFNQDFSCDCSTCPHHCG